MNENLKVLEEMISWLNSQAFLIMSDTLGCGKIAVME
jgi:hypothetical protein